MLEGLRNFKLQFLRAPELISSYLGLHLSMVDSYGIAQNS
jgi:hypothetical protein